MRRVRTVEGSCWPCKRRRIKCSLTKPHCDQCQTVGTECLYGSMMVRWSTRPNVFQARVPNAPSSSPIAVYQKRALDYFESRLWPLLSAERVPCSFPLDTAMRDRTVLQAICVIADAHRYLLDKRHSDANVQLQRLDVLTSIRKELHKTSVSDDQRQNFLSAVLLLYFLDGYIDCKRENAATLSHQVGVRAIINKMGGYQNVLASGNDALRLLVSEFATADLSTAMLRGTTPCFPSEIWTEMLAYRVWWASDTADVLRLGLLFNEISKMLFYGTQIRTASDAPSLEQVIEFETVFTPLYDSISCSGQAISPPQSQFAFDSSEDHALREEFFRIFQHCAIIYLYRVICGYPCHHHLVQQHVHGVVSKIMAMEDDCKLLNCVLLPMCIAAAHLENTHLQQGLYQKLSAVHQHLKFESVDCIKQWASNLWAAESLPEAWADLFEGLNPQAVVV